MGIRESLLNTITSVADSDFVRIVTSAGASSKATVRNLFKGFESNLSAKSSLTTSDYIRVVGSDNEVYKQSMGSVSDVLLSLISKNGSGSANDLVTSGLYWCNGASMTDLPNSSSFFRVRVEVYSGACNQYANLNGGSDIYFRTKSNNVWTSWIKLPTRAEVDALNNNMSSFTGGVPKRIAGSIPNGGSYSFTISSDYSANEGFALVGLNLSGNSLGGAALLYLGRGTGKYKDLIGSMSTSVYSVSYASNKWTITNSSGATLYYTIILTK